MITIVPNFNNKSKKEENFINITGKEDMQANKSWFAMDNSFSCKSL